MSRFTGEVAILGADGEKLGAAASKIIKVGEEADGAIVMTLRVTGEAKNVLLSSVRSDANTVRSLADAAGDAEKFGTELKVLADVKPGVKPDPSKLAGEENATGAAIKNASGGLKDVEVSSWSGRAIKMARNNPIKTVCGISVVTLTAVAGVLLGCTDGVTAHITNIKVLATNNEILVEYGSTNISPGCTFHPGVGDTIKFNGTTGWVPDLNGQGSLQITKIAGKNSIIVKADKPETTVGSTTNGTFTISSSFENQFSGLAADIVTTVVATAAQAAAAGLNAAAPVAANFMCTISPSLCNISDKMMWIIGIMCALCSCVLVIVLVMSTQK
jgi:hypothetical protein